MRICAVPPEASTHFYWPLEASQARAVFVLGCEPRAGTGILTSLGVSSGVSLFIYLPFLTAENRRRKVNNILAD